MSKGQGNPSQASGDRLYFPGVQAPGDRSHKVLQSDDPSQKNPGQAAGDRLHLPVFTRISQVTETEASLWTVIVGCRKENTGVVP